MCKKAQIRCVVADQMRGNRPADQHLCFSLHRKYNPSSSLIRNLRASSHLLHYENTPMQNTAIFHGCKNDKFQLIFFFYSHIFAQNIDCWYTLEPPLAEAVLTSTHNLCFRAKNKKKCIPLYTPVLLYKSGV